MTEGQMAEGQMAEGQMSEGQVTGLRMENREEKYRYKQDKYKDIISNIKLENPGYAVDQVTLVMDVFGGYGFTRKHWKNLEVSVNTRQCNQKHAKICYFFFI